MFKSREQARGYCYKRLFELSQDLHKIASEMADIRSQLKQLDNKSIDNYESKVDEKKGDEKDDSSEKDYI
jgi:hypothetical protein